jgi:Protein of unknown function (DUF3341)
MYLSGDFYDRETTEQAILDLKANGLATEDLALFSHEPVELAPGVLERPSHMSFVVVTATVVFALLVVGFVYFTQYDYPLATGGMPLFSFWATGVVFYEMTMFGAIAATFCWFLIESGLVRRIRGSSRRWSPPVLEAGTICLQIACRAEQVEAAARTLQADGAQNIRTSEGPV